MYFNSFEWHILDSILKIGPNDRNKFVLPLHKAATITKRRRIFILNWFRLFQIETVVPFSENTFYIFAFVNKILIYSLSNISWILKIFNNPKNRKRKRILKAINKCRNSLWEREREREWEREREIMRGRGQEWETKRKILHLTL